MRLRQFLLSLACLAALPAQAVELVKWERIPLPVALHVGQERIVFVNRNVRVGFPPELKGKLRVQSTGGAVYLQPGEQFDRTRLVLQDVENGEMILLDISAEEGKNVLEPVSLVYQGEVSSSTGNNDVAATDNQTPKTGERQSTSKPKEKKSTTPLPVALTRYAAQSLYAPSRTIEPLPGVHSISLALPDKLTSLLPSESVEVKPLAAWGLQGYSVVALTLRNQRAEKVVLDPRRLQGNFYSATFQHRWLGASGMPEDTTTVYLVTKGRPDVAFLPEPVKAKTGKGGKGDAN
ncbi:TPA: TIGR03749 family integrating conjugative element protein [Salmonella enterica]|uniref:TIGR03749 family integrating conjugative element protein n=2 Tax=Salmonella enterica TaxID=28901 RepID=A0A3V8I2Z6_SALER|nr:TIGR03749 family integrating conjugative element protein [Salmonella enterica]ECC9155759.1 TIGR03749 family integrating conjugative element protein [Salmonella enterica subsp. salamae]AZT26301.1 TIGR03749 family integrating conjugative element protein [Salmonella enterica subsp. salamae serovar 42:r:-]AZT52445.1 TIGR03749 family integrating conjugative element protein [Salmonella enterica subsp. salamae serovar 42:r:-]AZT56959.1 TIGR03749 family integrating conjugative element protein [Salmo